MAIDSIALALTRKAKEEARRLGFNLAGVTTPHPPPHLDVYERWLANGHHAGMSYLSSERARLRRADPRLILPECRAILVLGLNYLPSKRLKNLQPDAMLQIASYALGIDYHDVLIPRIEQIVDSLCKEAGREVQARIYTDTGPLLERELAQRAGLGWIGKNTCLIHPSHGSFLLLAEALLDLPLIPDQPFTADRCGTCTRCIEACPTACILPDRTIDAGRCISYLTIEERGSIPAELRPHIHNWVFGCDICQQVCPWNQRFAEPTHDQAFQPRPNLLDPQLTDFLALDTQHWSQTLQGSPLLRAKRSGLMRNAAIVAGNARASGNIGALSRVLFHDAEPLVREHAAWALGAIGNEKAIDALKRAQRTEQHPQVLLEIETSLEVPSSNSRIPRD